MLHPIVGLTNVTYCEIFKPALSELRLAWQCSWLQTAEVFRLSTSSPDGRRDTKHVRLVDGRNTPFDQLYTANKDTLSKVSYIVAIYTLDSLVNQNN
jgi:hypothetical protein